jgi:hypothetical protein
VKVSADVTPPTFISDMNPAQFKNRATWIRLLVIVLLALFVIAVFIWGPRLGAQENWNVVMTIATLGAVVAALFLDDIKDFLHRPEIEFYVGNDLLDVGHDMKSTEIAARWIRGKVTNVGDRGVKNCRLKILNVEGPNVPEPVQVKKITNGFLQWEGGIRSTMRLNPGESWIFDIGTRVDDVVLWAYFRADSVTSCNLRPPGTFTLTVAVYGDNIQSTDHTVYITIGEDVLDINVTLDPP